MRLASQHIAGNTFSKPVELAAWMGAMQAQDPAMIKWAFGCRIPGITEKAVDEALATGEILRTHLLRPTWHVVAAEDIYWLLELTAPQIRGSSRSRWEELELTPAIMNRSTDIIVRLLSDGVHRTREALMAELEANSIRSNDNRSAHIMFHAELEGLVCSGAVTGNKQTYRLLESCLPRPKSIPREEALTKLALRYFNSHGPATLSDFNWWSGLSIKDARTALEHVKSQLILETIGEETYWFSTEAVKANVAYEAHLLPAFDEFIISYRDRSAVLEQQHHARAVSTNGIFRPVVVVDGKVRGLWKRTVKKDTVLIEIELFSKLTAQEQQAVNAAAERFGSFLGKKVTLVTA